MHRGPDHRRHGHDAGHRHDHDNDHAGPGHNHPHKPHGVAQWQTPHLGPEDGRRPEQGEPDLDQVEAAFVEGFMAAGDPTSFLRLAGIPFEAKAPDGARLVLLRVEIDAVADVGSVTPHLGGASFRYDPMPRALVSRRRRLRFVYFDGSALRPLSFAGARTDLAPVSGRPDP